MMRRTGEKHSRRSSIGIVLLITRCARVAATDGNTSPGQSQSVRAESGSSSVWICFVLPGRLLMPTRFAPTSALMTVLLPTFGYPTKPTVPSRGRREPAEAAGSQLSFVLASLTPPESSALSISRSCKLSRTSWSSSERMPSGALSGPILSSALASSLLPRPSLPWPTSSRSSSSESRPGTGISWAASAISRMEPLLAANCSCFVCSCCLVNSRSAEKKTALTPQAAKWSAQHCRCAPDKKSALFSKSSTLFPPPSSAM
mmetsp:Transcript_119016/g.237271  ORF Transcript_119016/g.237271 Transcript_119016/m.237271 type:complete len:259 (+) Transcript_119016:547-1323(+)